jgi:hypothetical protein
MPASIMQIFTFPRLPVLAALLLLAACNPKYNWREVHAKDSAFTVLMPDKPVSATRKVNLGEQKVEMTMTAAEVDGVSFAVGYADLADAQAAQVALANMKTAMVHNIDGTITLERNDASTTTTPAAESSQASDIEAKGRRAGKEALLLGHFETKGKRVYQVIVLGNAEVLPRDEAKTFLDSFKPN